MICTQNSIQTFLSATPAQHSTSLTSVYLTSVQTGAVLLFNDTVGSLTDYVLFSYSNKAYTYHGIIEHHIKLKSHLSVCLSALYAVHTIFLLAAAHIGVVLVPMEMFIIHE